MLTVKQEKLLTSGVFARFAQSTKRTIHWYDSNGLLRPKKINSKGYRFYSIEQIIDLQVIMLLRKLNFSLPEIKKFLRKNSSTKDLFLQKKKNLLKEASLLNQKIQDISSFYTNLEKDDVLIKPNIKTIPSFQSYFIEKIGSYSKIYDYCFELKSYFSSIAKNATYFVLFPDREYSPKKDRMIIGVIKRSKMKLVRKSRDTVQEKTFRRFKSLHYKHVGSPALISLIIMQMHEYMSKKKIRQNLKIPINEIEFYKNSRLNGNPDENTMVSEVNIPVL